MLLDNNALDSQVAGSIPDKRDRFGFSSLIFFSSLKAQHEDVTNNKKGCLIDYV